MITLDDIQASLHSITVEATDLDIRDLDSASDSVSAVQSGAWSVEIADGGNSITVDAVDLDIRDLAFASDSVTSHQGGTWSVNISDNGGSITVDAVDLDIRDLAFASDSVTSHQGGTWAVEISDGGNSITVDAVDLDIRDLAFASDSVTAHQGGSWTVETTPGGYASWKVSAASVDDTVGGTELVPAPLGDRLSILVQNLGNGDIYLKEATGVTTANGMKLPKGSSFAANLDDAANLFAITASGSTDLRIVEYAA